MKLQEKLKGRNCESEKKFNQRGWSGISLNSVHPGTGCTPISYNPSYKGNSKELIETGVQGVQRCTFGNVKCRNCATFVKPCLLHGTSEGWQDRERTCVIFNPAVVEVTNG